MDRRIGRQLALIYLASCLLSHPVWAITDQTEAEPMTEEVFTPIFNAINEIGEKTPETTEADSDSREEITVDLITGRPLTPDGNGVIVDDLSQEEAEGKEFYTITTKSGGIYYLIIDKERASQNVYFLNAVDEADLADFLPETEAAAKEPETAPQAPTKPVEPESQENKETPNWNGISTLPILLVAGAAGGGVWFYRKKKRADNDPVPEFYDDEEYEEEEKEELSAEGKEE